MKYIQIIAIIMLSLTTNSYANYTISTTSRGIALDDDNTQTTLAEPQICSSIKCVFVSDFELGLLGVYLGDNATEILQSLHKMDDFDKEFLFYQLDNLDNIIYDTTY